MQRNPRAYPASRGPEAILPTSDLTHPAESSCRRTPPAYWDRACRELASRDPVLREIIDARRGEVLRGSGNAFRTLTNAIVGQQISVAAAAGIWGRLVRALPAFSPQALAVADAATLREAGLSRRKIEYVRGIAQAFVDGTADESEWARLDDAQLRDRLTAFRGIGPWTADMFLIFHARRPDILPLGDLGLVNTAARLYGWDDRPSRAVQLREHAELWRPWRTVATWYVWLVLDAKPVIY